MVRLKLPGIAACATKRHFGESELINPEQSVRGALSGEGLCGWVVCFGQGTAAEHERIHFGEWEDASGIFGSADDWFDAQVEAGTDKDRAAGAGLEDGGSSGEDLIAGERLPV